MYDITKLISQKQFENLLRLLPTPRQKRLGRKIRYFQELQRRGKPKLIYERLAREKTDVVEAARYNYINLF